MLSLVSYKMASGMSLSLINDTCMYIMHKVYVS